MTLIDQVKDSVPLLSYIQSDLGSQPKKVGTAFRFNPCPFCLHKDSFTVNADKNTFKCFSAACDKHGTVIDYEMLRRGLSDPFEAARAVASKMGIEEDRGAGAERRLTRERAKELRKICAEVYHGELLGTPEAMERQRSGRGHSEEILSQNLIGYASGNLLVKAVAGAGKGFDAEDLCKVGLMRKLPSRGYLPVIPKGAFVYPHLYQGAVLYFTIKVLKDSQEFQVKKAFADRDWICFHQDALLGETPPVICEGENDCLSVMDKGGYPGAVATIGNFNTPAILQHLKDNAKGRLYYLCADRDEAGAKYIEKWGAAILEGGGEARVIRVPEPYKDIDEVLCASREPASVFKALMSDAEAFAGGGGSWSDRYRFKTFCVLGELSGGEIVFQANDIQKIHIVNIKDLTMEKFVQIGGQEVKERVVRTIDEASQDGKVHLYDLRKQYILQARTTQLGALRWFGQGINALDSGRLLIVNGNESYIWDGKRIESYSSSLLERRLISRKAYARWIDMDRLGKRLSEMSLLEMRKVQEELMTWIRQWHFAGRFDHELIVGFLLASIVQNLWTWRPQLWVTGPQGSGKTMLLNFIEEIGGHLARRFEGASTSEPGFRQGIGDDMVIGMIDEFEKSPARDQIISYLRTAGRGGVIYKGSASQQDPREYFLKHMIMVASIETGLVRAAERTRYITVETVKDPERKPVFPQVREMERLRIDVFAAAIWASIKCRDLVADMARIKGFDGRLVESYAVPYSMHSVTDEDPARSLTDYVSVTLNQEDLAAGDIQEDEDRLLDDILSSTIRVAADDLGSTVYTDRSIMWCLQSASTFHREDAAACGVWALADGALFLATDIIKRKLLRDTPWKDLNITGILRRLQGAERHRVKRNSKFYKGIRYENQDLIRQIQPEKQGEMF